MREFEIEQVSLSFKWNYEILAQSLPVVGTEAFGVLCKRLAPFGINAARIIAEAPSNKLGDAQMTIILLDGRLGIRFTISSFEIISDEFYDGDEQNLIDIGDIVFDALRKIDENVVNGTSVIRLTYHLKLASNEKIQLLQEHLSSSSDFPELIPEVATYKINLDKNRDLKTARVVLADSLVYGDSIFLDINLSYSKFDDIARFAGIVTNDIAQIFDIFKLNGKNLLDS